MSALFGELVSFRMEVKDRLQHGQMVDVLHHSEMQAKQNSCKHSRLPLSVSYLLRQMGHIFSYVQPCLFLISAVFSSCFFTDCVGISTLAGVCSLACWMDFVSKILHSSSFWELSSSFSADFIALFLNCLVEGVDMISLGELMRASLRELLEYL